MQDAAAEPGQADDTDLADMAPPKLKQRGALASDVFAETLARAKPILQQAATTLMGPEYDAAKGATAVCNRCSCCCCCC